MVAALATDEQALIVAIVLARLLVPLLIPRFPLAILAALVLDAVDNSLLGAFTNVDLGPDGPYQSADKALDIYYLAIAYVSTLRNWTNLAAIRVGQFLFYYRLVGRAGLRAARVAGDAAAVPQHVRVLLHRLRGGRAALRPGADLDALLGARRGRAVDLRQAAAGVLDPHRAARLHRRRRRPPVVRRRQRAVRARAARRGAVRRPSAAARARSRLALRRRGARATAAARRRSAWGELAEKAALLSLLCGHLRHDPAGGSGVRASEVALGVVADRGRQRCDQHAARAPQRGGGARRAAGGQPRLDLRRQPVLLRRRRTSRSRPRCSSRS